MKEKVERIEIIIVSSTAVSLNYKLINDYYIYKNIYLVYIYNTVIGNAEKTPTQVARQSHSLVRTEKRKYIESNARDGDRERVDSFSGG